MLSKKFRNDVSIIVDPDWHLYKFQCHGNVSKDKWKTSANFHFPLPKRVNFKKSNSTAVYSKTHAGSVTQPTGEKSDFHLRDRTTFFENVGSYEVKSKNHFFEVVGGDVIIDRTAFPSWNVMRVTWPDLDKNWVGEVVGPAPYLKFHPTHQYNFFGNFSSIF